ncbi:collagen binding domain-containing protein [Listeria booriae]|nr:collagen binding domain-containing protein [Listeria booriae]
MKRFFSLFAALLLILQMILPQMVLAQTTTDAKETDGAVLVNIIVNKNTDSTSNYTISGRMVNHSDEAKVGTVKVSDNVEVSAIQDAVVTDDQQQVIGKYDVTNNEITFPISGNSDTVFNFQVNGKYVGDSTDDQVTFSDGVHVISKDAGKTAEPQQEETTVTVSASPAQPEEAAVPKRDTVVKKVKENGPRDLKDIFAELGYPSEESSILSDMKVTYRDKDGNVITEPTVNDKIEFAFDWNIPNDVGELVNAGDYYTFELPDNIKIPKNMIIDLGEFGTATVDTNGKVTITFTDEVKNNSDVNGTLHFDAGFNENAIDGPGDMTIKIPDEVNLPSTEVPIKPYGAAMIDKSGHFDKVQNPDRVIWNVDINKGLKTIDNAKVTEAFPDGLTYESVKVYQIDVDLHGKVIPDSEKLVTTGYTVDANGNVTFTEPIDGAYQLEYTTKINDDKKPFAGGTVNFKNNATLTADNLDDLTTSATVSAKYGKVLAKSATNYNSKDQTFDWTIKYNYGEKHISKDDAVIKDTFGSDKMILVSDSVQLYNMTFNQSGKEIQGAALVEGTDYELIPTANGFEIHFLHDVDGAVKIDYKTGVSDTLTENTNISNKVDVSTGQSSNGSGTMYQQSLVKRLGDVNYDTKTASWVIDVNKNHYFMKNWEMIDTLSPGLTLIPDSLKVYDVDQKHELVAGTDYDFVYDEGTNVFKITFLNSYKDGTENQFRISYDTKYDMNVVRSNDSELSFKNDASATWTDQNGDPKTSKDSVVFKPNDPTKYNGFKNGSYNAQTKLITWSIGVNYDSIDLENAKVVDPILGNQQFVPGSVKIYHYTINHDGSIVKGAEISDYSEFVISEPSNKNDNTLTVNFPDGKATMYLIEFDTSVKGQLVSANYKNDAVFQNDTYPDQTLSADVSVTNGGKFAVKSRMQDDDGYVNWSVTVNPSLSQLDDVVMTDRPSTNQSIDLDSLVIYGTTVNADGTLVVNKNVKLTKDMDYTATLTTDNETGQQELKVTFAKQLNTAYVVQYRTMVLMTGDKDKVSNNVKITGNHEEEVTGGSETTLDVVVSNGGGTAVGTKGSITFQKVDPNDAILHGAKFQLLDKNNRVVVREGTIDQDGKLTFGNLPYGTYYLKEVKAPEGFSASDELVNGKKVTISKDTTNAKIAEKIVNAANKVTFVKQNEAHDALSGAIFKLQWQVGDEWLDIRGDETFETDSDGRLVIEGLLPANYRLVETVAPHGYVLNTEPIPFAVTQDSNGQIADVDVAPFVNYKGSFEFEKQDDAGNALSDAVFILQDQTGETVATLASSSDGKVSATDLAPGDYTITEVKAPTGYTLNTKPIHFTIANQANGKPATEMLDNFTNYKGKASLKKNGEDGAALTGAVFQVTDQEGNVIRENLVTNLDGIIDVTDLAPGTYHFIETAAPTGYLINETPVEFTIADNANGEPVKVQTQLTDYQGSVVLKKINDSGQTLEGAAFDLLSEDGTVISSLVTDADGKVSASGLAPGNYYFTETAAPVGYKLDSTPIPFTILTTAVDKPELIELEFTNKKLPPQILPPKPVEPEKPTTPEKPIKPMTPTPTPKPLEVTPGDQTMQPQPIPKAEVTPKPVIKPDTKLPQTGDNNTETVLFTLLGTAMIAAWFRWTRKQ